MGCFHFSLRTRALFITNLIVLLLILNTACHHNRPPPVIPSTPITQLSADFTFAPAANNTLQVQFSDNSQGIITGRSWRFGDNSPAVSDLNPSHTFLSAGSYVVTLEVSDGVAADQNAQLVTVYEAPLAAFSAQPDASDVKRIHFSGPPADVYANPMGGASAPASISNWSWDLGDGSSQLGETFTHQYAAEGVYTVTLTTTGPGGSATETVDIVVGNAPPVVDFSTLISTSDSQEIHFQNLSTGSVQTWLWDFGDGNQSSVANPVHGYQHGGSYSVTLTATGAGGTDTTTQTLQVADREPDPLITFTPSASDPHTILFVGSASERVDSWSWDFGDFDQGSGQTITHNYANAGGYSVTVTANGPGGIGSVTQMVPVGVQPPSIDFSHAPSAQMYGIELTPVVSGTVNSLEISFGDGDSQTLTASNPGAPNFPPITHNYTAAGSYPVTMTAFGPAGDPSTTQTIVITEPPLSPAIGTNTTNGVAPVGINFSGSSTGNVQSWQWNFGDGNSAIGQNVSHTYTSAGNFTATLTVTGPAGTVTDSINMNIAAQFQAVASASILSGDAPLTVDFTNQSTGQGLITYSWDFGDGNTSTELNPTHTFQNANSFTVTLTATDTVTGQVSSSNLIINATAIPLEARIGANRLEGNAPFVLFAEDDSLGSITGWHWDFGDGSPVIDTNDPDLGREVTYSYTTPGRYLLKLRVSGPLPAPANEDEILKEIIVRDPNVIPPIARIHADPVIGSSPHQVIFTNASEGTYSSLSWDFGDGNTTTSTANSITHTYSSGGDYLVTLSLLGPAPNHFPITAASEVISVDIGPEPGLGPPAASSTGGVSTTALPRPTPGTGGSSTGGSSGTGLPGNSAPQIGPGWAQASVLRYEPMAGLNFSNAYQVVRASAGTQNTALQCNGPCTTEACGLMLDSPFNNGDPRSLAVVSNNSGKTYVGITAREVLNTTGSSFNHDRYRTAIRELSTSGTLSAAAPVMLNANTLYNSMQNIFPASQQFMQTDRSSFILDDLILLDSGILAAVGRIRIYYDYGSNTYGSDELPGIFAIDPSSGNLLWSLYGEMYQPDYVEQAEVRANINHDRFLLWILRGDGSDGVLYEGRIPGNGQYLQARRAADLINDYKLADYAIGPDESIYAVVRDESPLACFNSPVVDYQLRVFNKELTQELANPISLDLDYSPHHSVYSYSYRNPRKNPQRRLVIEPDGNNVRAILHGSVWPKNKTECALYRGSSAAAHPAVGQGCPATIIKNYCCDDPGVAARNPGVCTGAQDKGVCPCRGIDPSLPRCAGSGSNIEACDTAYSTFALEQVILNRTNGPFTFEEARSRHRVAAVPAGGMQSASQYVTPLALTSDGQGRVTYLGNSAPAIINLDDPDNNDIKLTANYWTSTGTVLTDRASTPRSIHGSLGSLRVIKHDAGLDVNNEESWAWPVRTYTLGSVVIPVGNGRLISLDGGANLSAVLYQPTSNFFQQQFADHNKAAPSLTPCLDSAGNCTNEYQLFSNAHMIWDDYSFCRRWTPHPRCDQQFLDRWEYRHTSSRTWRMPRMSARVAAATSSLLQSPMVSNSSIYRASARQQNAYVRLGGVQARCDNYVTQQVETRPYCPSWDSRRNVCAVPWTTQERKEFRCDVQRDVFTPIWRDNGITPLPGGWQRFHVNQYNAEQCSDVGLALPVVTVKYPGPQFNVTETVNGNSATINVTRPAPGNVTVKIISGDALLPNNTSEMQITGNSVQVQAGNSSTVLVEVEWDGQLYSHYQKKTVALNFERTGLSCRAEGNKFRQCTVRHPMPVLAEVDQPQRHAPATVGKNIDLSTRSIWKTDIDTVLPSIDMPLVVSRHYIPPKRPTVPSPDPSFNPISHGAELGPGWRLNLIEWLLPITNNTDTSALEDPANGFDLALHADGRVETFEYPANGPSATGTLSGDDRIFLLNSAGVLREKSFPATVVKYESPTGYEGELRSYTITPNASGSTASIHPFYDPLRSEVAPDEQRFYVLTEYDGHMRVYNCKGQLIRIITPRRHEMVFIYEGPRDRNTNLKVLSGVVDTNGRLTSLRWYHKPSGLKLDRIVLPDGRMIEYAYTYQKTTLASVTLNFDARVALTTSTNPSPIDPKVRLQTGYGYTSDNLLRFDFVTQNNLRVRTVQYGYQGQDVVSQKTGAGDRNTIAHTSQDGGVMNITYSTTGAVVKDESGTDRTYVLTQPGGAQSAKSVASITLRAEVFNNDINNPAHTLEDLVTTYQYDNNGYLEVEDAPGPGTVTTRYDSRGELIEKIITGASATDRRRWQYIPQYQDYCLRRLEAIDPTGASTVMEYYPFNTAKPGQICQLKSITEPTVTDAGSGGGSHTYVTEYQYYGAQNTSGPQDMLLRGMVSKEIRSEVGGSSNIKVIDKTYWATTASRGVVASVTGRTAYSKLGLLKLQTTRGDIPNQCSSNVLSQLQIYKEYDSRGNNTLIRHWSVPTSQPESAPANPFEAWQEEFVYDQANRLFSSKRNGILTEFTHNARGQVVEVQTESKDLFNGSDLNWATFNAQQGKKVTRNLYLHNGKPYAVLSGNSRPQADPEFNHFEYFAYDGLGRETVKIEPGPGMSDAQRYQIIYKLLSACPGQNTPAAPASSCAVKAFNEAGFNALNISTADIANNGAPLKITNTQYSKDGYIIQQRIHNGVGGVSGSTGRLARAFLDNKRNMVLNENGTQGKNGNPVREHFQYTAFNDLRESTLYDPEGCAGGYTPLRNTQYQNHDDMGRPGTVIVRGDDGRVADHNSETISNVCAVTTELSRAEMTYNEVGQLKTNTRHVHVLNGQGIVHFGTYASKQVQFVYRYHPLGGVSRESIHNKHENSYYDYTGAVCARTTTAGTTLWKETKYALDGLARITQETTRHLDANGHNLGAPHTSESFTYDQYGNRSVTKDALNRQTKHYYDSLGRQRATEQYNDNNDVVVQREMRYDPFGNLQREFSTTAEGRTGTYRSFNGEFLIEETTTVDGSWATRRHFVLDHEGRPIKIKPHGSDSEVITRELDNSGRIIRETLRLANADVTEKRFEYNALNKAIKLTATDKAQPRVSAWDETKHFRYNALGQLTFAQNVISDPASTANARNGVVANVWMERDTLGKVRQEGIKLFDRDIQVTDTDHIVNASYDAVGKIGFLHYDNDIARANRPSLAYRYDNRMQLTNINVSTGMEVGRFEIKNAGNYVMQRKWFDKQGVQKHTSNYAYDRLLRRYQVTHELGDVRLESRKWFRNNSPVWTRNLSYHLDGGQWQENADNNLVEFPNNQCNSQPTVEITTGQYSVSEITTKPCFNPDRAVRVLSRTGWQEVDQTGIVGSQFSGTHVDGLGRTVSQTSYSYSGEMDEEPGPSVARRRVVRNGGRIAHEQKVEIGAGPTGFFSSTYDWKVRAITDFRHAYEGMPLISGIRCDNQAGNLDTTTFHRYCGSRENRFEQPPINRFPGQDKAFDAINIAGIWRLSELKQDQRSGFLVNPPTAPSGPDQAVYRNKYGAFNTPVSLKDDITHVTKYEIEYDLFGRQVKVTDNHYLGAATAPKSSHRFLYDALDRLIYEDYQGLNLNNDDNTLAPTFYGYYGKNLIRERVEHPVYADKSDRVYVYGPGTDLIYTARSGTTWDSTSQPPVAHIVLEDYNNNILSLYFQRGSDGKYHRLQGEIKNSKIRNYIRGEVDQSLMSVTPWWTSSGSWGNNLDSDDLKESFKQFSPQVRSSPFDEMVYSDGAGFARSRTASWRTNEWQAIGLTQNEWLQDAAQHRMIASAALVAGAVVSAGYGATAAGALIGMGTGAISAYDVHMRVQDQGWTEETKSEAGWIAFGMATDLATLGGTRFISAAKAAESAQRAALSYQLAQVGWSAMGADAAFGDNCFTAGTQVWTEHGMRSIEEIKEGDLVWSWDQQSGETSLQPVLQTFKNTTQEIILIHIGNETIATTPEHPMWVESDGWVLAGELQDGDYVRTYSGIEPITLNRQQTITEIPIFNIDVAGGDTFYVGNMFMLTHNTSLSKLLGIKFSASQVNKIIDDAIQKGMQNGLIVHKGSRIRQTLPSGRVVTKKGPKRHYFNLDELRRPAQIVKGKLDPAGVNGLTWKHYLAIMSVGKSHKYSYLKKQIGRMLRNGGGKHEMLPVGMFPHMVKIGVPVSDIHLLTLPTKTTKFKVPGIPIGKHHGSHAGTEAHNILFKRLLWAQNRSDAAAITAEFHKQFVCGLAGLKC